MGKLLSNFRTTILLSIVLAGVMILSFGRIAPGGFDQSFWQAVLRWLHTLSGILWIGLLYYFNFVQSPTMPKIPDELKPGVSKYIAPSALFYFRWGAAFTVLTGLGIAFHNGYGAQALTFQGTGADGINLIGIGMWLAIIMAFNVEANGKDDSAVIDVTRLFTTEVTEFSARTRLRARGFDSSRSFIEKTKSFPTTRANVAAVTMTMTMSGMARARFKWRRW